MSKQSNAPRLYTKSHEWVEVNGDIATIGITDHAQELLGDIVYVELPEATSSFKVKDSAGVIESVKAASDFYSPITGTIVEINTELENAPELINSDPYQQGWLYKIQIQDKAELENLLSEEKYLEQVNEG